MLSGFDGLRFAHWHPQIRDDGVVVLSLDRQDSSVNAMSQDVLLELGDLIERIGMDPPKAVVIQSIKPMWFTTYLILYSMLLAFWALKL